MSKTYRPYDPDQQLLLPAALQEWLPDDHLAYFISDVVDQLDLSSITARYEGERRGGPPYHPRMMVKVLIYGYCVGVASSRRIAQRLHEDIAFRVLAANNTPDFRTISDFRKDHLGALSGLFLQVLAFCQRAGLVKLGHVALDGTKVRANASRHKAMSYRRMKEKEEQLAAEVAELLRRAQEVDDEEDRRYGKDKRGDELPEELAFREGRLEKIREAMAALEAEAQAAAEAEGKEHPGVPEDKAQRNFTDAESRIMPAPGGRDFLQAYNCQAAAIPRPVRVGASISGGSMSSLTDRHWMETRWRWQLQRVERYYRRCQQLVEGDNPVTNDLELYELSDLLISFFVHCYHLKDWLKTDTHYPACRRNSPCGQARCPECWVNDHPPLKICADNANGVKHLIFKNAKVDEFEIEAGKIGNLEDRMSCFSKHPPDDAVWGYLTQSEGWRSPPECDGCIDYQDRRKGIDRGPFKCEGCADPFVIATDAIEAWRTFVQNGEGITPEAYTAGFIPQPWRPF